MNCDGSSTEYLAGDLNNFSLASYSYNFSDGADLVTRSSRVHPERAAHCARNAAESFNS